MPASADKTDLNHLESEFDYQFSRPHGRREFEKLNTAEKSKVEDRLNSLKEKTWHEIVNMSRKKGLTPERSESGKSAYNKTKGRADKNHIRIYPFHLRVPSINKRFRIFGYQHKNIFYITQIDKNHKQHR